MSGWFVAQKTFVSLPQLRLYNGKNDNCNNNYREIGLNLLSICGFLFVSLDVVQQKQFINIRSVVQTTRRAPRSALRL